MVTIATASGLGRDGVAAENDHGQGEPPVARPPGRRHERKVRRHARSIHHHQGRPDNLDDGTAFTRDEVMPAIQQINGCIGLSMLADRESGRCIVTTSWADADAMRAATEDVHPIRLMQALGAQSLGSTSTRPSRTPSTWAAPTSPAATPSRATARPP